MVGNALPRDPAWHVIKARFRLLPLPLTRFTADMASVSRLWTCHAGSRGSASLGLGRDLHGILMLTRMLAAAERDFCGLATRFAVVWAFCALWLDFLVSNTRVQPLTAKREMSGLYAFAQSGISHDHRAAPHGPKVPYTTHCDLG